MSRSLIIAVFMTVFSSLTFADNGQGCLSALVKNVSTISDNSASSYALMSLVNSSLNSSEQASLGAQIVIPDVGPVGLTSNQAQTITKNFFSSTNISWDQERMINMVSETLPKNAVEAYRICVAGSQKDGVFANAYDATDAAVQIEVRWVAGVGAKPDAVAKFDVEGVKPIPGKKIIPDKLYHTGDTVNFTVDRAPGQDIRVNVNIAGASAHLFIPYIPKVSVTSVYHGGITFPIPEIALRNDGSNLSSNVTRSDCAHPAPNYYLIPNSGKPIINQSGPNDGSYGIVEQNDNSVCYKMLFRPNAADHLSTWNFHIQYDEVSFVYAIVPPPVSATLDPTPALHRKVNLPL